MSYPDTSYYQTSPPSPSGGSGGTPYVPTGKAELIQQIDAQHLNVTQNTWYTLLDTKYNIRLYSLRVAIVTAAEDIAVRLTINGTATTITQAGAVDSTSYYAAYRPGSGLILTTLEYNIGWYEAITFRSLKIEARKTSANNAGSDIYYTIVYSYL